MYAFMKEDQLEIYEAFLKNHPNGNFLQAPCWSKVKREWESVVILSLDSEGQVRGSMNVFIRKVPHLPYTFLYSGRGPVCDSNDIDAMKDLAEGLNVLAKERKAYEFRGDPGVRADDETFRKNITAAGFHVKETGKNFDGVQPRFVFRLDIENKTEQELFEAFHSKTRYNIRLAERKGVSVRLGTKEDLPKFREIMKETGERDGFRTRDLAYFERMYDALVPENMRLYVAEYEGEIVAGTIPIYYGDKTWYLYGASSNAHRNVMPNYLLQMEMIRWALEKKCKIYDFRGVSGDISPDNPLYGLYRFKKGFSGELVEFIGEIEIIFKPLVKKAADMAQNALRKKK